MALGAQPGEGAGNLIEGDQLELGLEVGETFDRGRGNCPLQEESLVGRDYDADRLVGRSLPADRGDEPVLDRVLSPTIGLGDRRDTDPCGELLDCVGGVGGDAARRRR